jgi:hypothetical protein
MARVCADCAYSSPNNKVSVVCHRYPPKITSVEGANITSYFPILSLIAWCGEWKHGKSKHPQQEKPD